MYVQVTNNKQSDNPEIAINYFGSIIQFLKAKNCKVFLCKEKAGYNIARAADNSDSLSCSIVNPKNIIKEL